MKIDHRDLLHALEKKVLKIVALNDDPDAHLGELHCIVEEATFSEYRNFEDDENLIETDPDEFLEITLKVKRWQKIGSKKPEKKSSKLQKSTKGSFMDDLKKI
jgi:hypothetical protein